MAIRKDKIKNTAKVTKEVLKDPLASQREIAKRAKVGLGTANRILQELEQKGTESQMIEQILEMDDKIIALSNGLTLDMIKDKINQGEVLTVQDHKVISDIANNSTKRKAIFDNKNNDDKQVTFIIG